MSKRGAPANTTKAKRSKQPTTPDLDNCAAKPFRDKAHLDEFIASGNYYVVDIGDTSDLREQFKQHQFAFHNPGSEPFYATKAGWGMSNDQNVAPVLFDSINLLKGCGLDLPGMALKSFSMKHGYAYLAPDRFKYQLVGPGYPTEQSKIVQHAWKKPNSVHVDLREDGEDQLACLAVLGRPDDPSRHMVLTDLSRLDAERKELKARLRAARAANDQQSIDRIEREKDEMGRRHMRIYELMHAVKTTQKGKYDFTPDEKLLIKPVLTAVEIKPNRALFFPQFLPHCLTESLTSSTQDARALTIYIGIKMSTDRSVLERSKSRLVDLFATGGQHCYQVSLGKNGFTDKAINEEHLRKILPWMFDFYKIPPIDGGKGGFSKNNPFPTVKQFIEDVRRARADPANYPDGMTCDHLDLDNILKSRAELDDLMEIVTLG